MTIEFQCDNCQKTLRTADDKAGRSARCPQCGKELVVPDLPAGDFDEFAPPPKESHLSDFEELAQAPPRSRPKPVEITCPMCGTVNESTASRCSSCSEPLANVPTTRFSDIWNRAWEIWTANLGINVAATAICGGIYIGLSFIVGIVFGVAAAAAGGMGGEEGLVFTFGLQIIQNLISGICLWYLMVGLARFAIENTRTENPSLASLFTSGSQIFPILGTMFCYALLTVLCAAPGLGLMIGAAASMADPANQELSFVLLFGGMALYFLGVMIVWVLYWPLPYMLADRSEGFFQSLFDAPRMAARFFKLSALMSLTFFGLSLAGVLACCIGVLFAYPLSFIMMAVAYDRCRLSMKALGDSGSLARELP